MKVCLVSENEEGRHFSLARWPNIVFMGKWFYKSFHSDKLISPNFPDFLNTYETPDSIQNSVRRTSNSHDPCRSG